MDRLTKNLPIEAMGMYELHHNNCYIGENHVAMYKDYDGNTDTRSYIRFLMKKYCDWTDEIEEMQDDDAFDYTMHDNLQYGERCLDGIIALLYIHMWSK